MQEGSMSFPLRLCNSPHNSLSCIHLKVYPGCIIRYAATYHIWKADNHGHGLSLMADMTRTTHTYTLGKPQWVTDIMLHGLHLLSVFSPAENLSLPCSHRTWLPAYTANIL